MQRNVGKSIHYYFDENFNTKRALNIQKKSRNSILPIAKYLNIGYYLITPLLLGVFFGLGIDKFFSTNNIFTFIGIMLGTVSTFYNLNKIIKDF